MRQMGVTLRRLVEFGFMTGLKSRGPKPHRMAQVLPELRALALPSFSKNAPCLSEILCKDIRGLQTPIWGVGVQWGAGFLKIQPMPVVGVAANACRQFRKSLL